MYIMAWCDCRMSSKLYNRVLLPNESDIHQCLLAYLIVLNELPNLYSLTLSGRMIGNASWYGCGRPISRHYPSLEGLREIMENFNEYSLFLGRDSNPRLCYCEAGLSAATFGVTLFHYLLLLRRTVNWSFVFFIASRSSKPRALHWIALIWSPLGNA